jgi:cytochrome c556
MRFLTLLISILIAVVTSACGEAADSRPGQPVSERRAAFKKILLAFEPMGIALRDKKYAPDQFIVMAGQLAQVKDGPWSHFGPAADTPPTHAKASIWSDAGRFAADRQAFLQATDRLLIAAENRDEKVVTIAYQAVHDSCRNCHKAFKD